MNWAKASAIDISSSYNVKSPYRMVVSIQIKYPHIRIDLLILFAFKQDD